MKSVKKEINEDIMETAWDGIWGVKRRPPQSPVLPMAGVMLSGLIPVSLAVISLRDMVINEIS